MKKQEFWHSMILVAILVFGFVSFYLTIGNKSVQLFVGFVMTTAYVLWGIMHHRLSHRLHSKVVIEYILIGAIAIVLLLTLAI